MSPIILAFIAGALIGAGVMLFAIRSEAKANADASLRRQVVKLRGEIDFLQRNPGAHVTNQKPRAVYSRTQVRI